MNDSKVTLVTGASSGIGSAIASSLLAQGERVAITGRHREKLDAFAAAQDAPDRLLPLVGDASINDDVNAAVDATTARFGRLDAVVANAGVAVPGSVADGDPEDCHAMVMTNVLGPALLIRAALPRLRESKGRIVLIGSVAGLVYTTGNFYGATKWAVTGLAENTRRLVTGDGVGVTLIALAATETPFWDVLGGAPERALLSAEHIAASVVWAMGQPEGVDVSTVTVRPTKAPV